MIESIRKVGNKRVHGMEILLCRSSACNCVPGKYLFMDLNSFRPLCNNAEDVAHQSPCTEIVCVGNKNESARAI